MNGTSITTGTTFTDYLNQIYRVHKDEMSGKMLTRRTPDEWSNNSISKDMERINRSEHIVELGCLSY